MLRTRIMLPHFFSKRNFSSTITSKKADDSSLYNSQIIPHDYLLSLSIGKQTAGYALFPKDDIPIKLGIIDLHDLPNASQIATEVVGVATLLKNLHTNPNLSIPNEKEPVHLYSKETTNNNSITWLVTVEQHTRNPFTSNEAKSINSINKVIGIVENDCSRLFKTTTISVMPKTARQYIGRIFRRNLETREKLNEFARSQVKNFPSIKDDKDRIIHKSYFMSDAWVAGLYCKKIYQGELIKKDPSFKEIMKKVFEGDKRINDLKVALEGITNFQMENELTEVIKSRREKLTNERIRSILMKQNKES